MEGNDPPWERWIPASRFRRSQRSKGGGDGRRAAGLMSVSPARNPLVLDVELDRSGFSGPQLGFAVALVIPRFLPQSQSATFVGPGHLIGDLDWLSGCIRRQEPIAADVNQVYRRKKSALWDITDRRLRSGRWRFGFVLAGSDEQSTSAENRYPDPVWSHHHILRG